MPERLNLIVAGTLMITTGCTAVSGGTPNPDIQKNLSDCLKFEYDGIRLEQETESTMEKVYALQDKALDVLREHKSPEEMDMIVESITDPHDISPPEAPIMVQPQTDNPADITEACIFNTRKIHEYIGTLQEITNDTINENDGLIEMIPDKEPQDGLNT